MVDLAQLPRIELRQLLNGEVVALDIDRGQAAIRYLPPAQMKNPNGSIQGGFITAMLDDVAGLLTHFACGERAFSTAHISLAFLRPAPAGEWLAAEATLVQAGRRQALLDVSLVREDGGKLCAKGSLLQVFVDASG